MQDTVNPQSNKPEYCDINDVKQYLPPNIIVQKTANTNTTSPRNPSPSSLTESDIEYFIQQASMRLQASLAIIYDVPLKKVNQGGDIDYPYPIRPIVALWASDMIFSRRLKGVDTQLSQTVKDELEFFENTIAQIQNGEIKLAGQRATNNIFIKNTLFPMPMNPSQGGRSKKG